MDAEAVFHQYLGLLNQQKWSQLGQVLANPLSYNDRTMGSDAYLRSLQDDIEASSITGWKMDILVHDRKSNAIGARLLLSAHATTKADDQTAAPDGNLIQYAQHTLFAIRAGKISEIKAITDADMANQSLDHVDPSPQPLSKEGSQQRPLDLYQFYTSYIGCINSRTMETELHKYCLPHVIWGGRKLPVDEYRKVMEDSFDAISGLSFDVRDLVVDDDRQQIFSRIEFTGVPVRSYAGVEPNGRTVRFAEHAMYWLDAGKIARVVTVIDWKAYRKQLTS
ncbi:hypothetical protein GE09DRAFT_1091405 [Coniochaeta sp. 2T2.1]|nr:hypothetical protein GE09DRAFT_1091405 [Coniochaeta sp. 2T2.1]